jgi:hypothetical protein
MIRAENEPGPELSDWILCLANSYKHDHRCVAGINLMTKQWVRLVGKQVSGCLTRKEASYPDGKEVALLDVFKAELGEPCGSNCHPEDVQVTGKPWTFVRSFNQPADLQVLASFIHEESTVLDGYCDRIDRQRFETTPARCSLGLNQPDDLWWWIREDHGKRKNRALFRLGNIGRTRYDLPITDPATLNTLKLLPAGIHPDKLIRGNKMTRTLLTISLSEPFDGFLYKLVAGVIHLPF